MTPASWPLPCEHIDIEQIAELIKNPQASGVILEVEDHKDNERVVISMSVTKQGPLRSEPSN